MKREPFSLAVDGSNDSGIEKLNPLTVRIYDANRRQVVTCLLDMCTTSGRDCGTAQSIFTKIDSVLDKHEVKWNHCVAFGVDNTSVNLGIRNSIMTRVQAKHPSCYFMGCPCHLIHNIASRASDGFQKEVKFDVEDVCVDVYYWFDKSTKRKGTFREFCSFCDTEYREVVRYVSVRWLSLETSVHRILQLYASLVSYFKSEEESQARFHRLQVVFEEPMTEVYLFFYQSILPTFTSINLLLQREDPSIYLVADALHNFLQKILSKFVKIDVIRSRKEDLTKVDFVNRENQLDDNRLAVGFTTRQKMNILLQEGDITDRQCKCFYKGVREFYVTAVSQALKTLPFNDCLLNHCRFVNFEGRNECTFESVEYFCSKYPDLLNFTAPQMDSLEEQFLQYQLLDRSEIPLDLWKEATVYEVEKEGQRTSYYRMDVIWGHLSLIRNIDSSFRFALLTKVAKLILTIPHSNAGEERVFNLIKLNRTPTRSSLNTDGTLSSLIQIKLANQDSCIDWEPPTDLLKTAKKATKVYNDLHKRSN